MRRIQTHPERSFVGLVVDITDTTVKHVQKKQRGEKPLGTKRYPMGTAWSRASTPCLTIALARPGTLSTALGMAR